MAKNFYKSLMMSEDVQSMLYSGVFVDVDDNEAECHNGAIVVQGDMADHSVYAGLKDPNVFKIAAPVADTDEVAIVDYVDVSRGEIMGVEYREGIKTYGLVAPKGKKVRVRRLAKHDTGYFSADNFVSTPAVGEYAVPTAGDTLWTPVAEAATDKTCIKIHFSKPTTLGMVNTGVDYFVEFVNVVR